MIDLFSGSGSTTTPGSSQIEAPAKANFELYPPVVEDGNGEDSPPSNNPGKSSRFANHPDMSVEDFIDNSKADATKKVEQSVLNLFEEYLNSVHSKKYSGKSLKDVADDEVADLVQKFFMAMRKEDGSSYCPSSLQTYYRAMVRLLESIKGINAKTDERFSKMGKIVNGQQKRSVEEGLTAGMNSSKAIPPSYLAESWKAGYFGNSNPVSLRAAVALLFQSTFGLRGVKEMYQILNGDVQVGPAREDGIPSFLKLGERITKTSRGKKGEASAKVEAKMFPDDKNPERCGVRLFKLYQSKKPAKALTSDFHFWINCKNVGARQAGQWEKVDVWYSAQVMGQNTIGKLVSEQIKLLGVDVQKEKISSTSVRKTLIDGLMFSGMAGEQVSKIVGHRSLLSKTSYMSSDEATLKASNQVIKNTMAGQKYEGESYDVLISKEKDAEVSKSTEDRKDDEVKRPVLQKESLKRKKNPQYYDSDDEDEKSFLEFKRWKEMNRQQYQNQETAKSICSPVAMNDQYTNPMFDPSNQSSPPLMVPQSAPSQHMFMMQPFSHQVPFVASPPLPSMMNQVMFSPANPAMFSPANPAMFSPANPAMFSAAMFSSANQAMFPPAMMSPVSSPPFMQPGMSMTKTVVATPGQMTGQMTAHMIGTNGKSKQCPNSENINIFLLSRSPTELPELLQRRKLVYDINTMPKMNLVFKICPCCQY